MVPTVVPMLQPTIPPEIRAHGPAIREFRLCKGMSRNQVATHIGVTRQFLGRLERGQRGATRETLEKLAAAIGVPFDAITYPESW
jgi:transcriptional regulator with XRE-family HTH domain